MLIIIKDFVFMYLFEEVLKNCMIFVYQRSLLKKMEKRKEKERKKKKKEKKEEKKN